MATQDSGEFWQKVSDKKLDDRDAAARGEWKATPGTPKKRSKARLFIFIGAGVVLILLGLVGLAPTIAGAVAPGMIASRSPGYINGAATVDSTEFSWGGPQRINGLKIVDAAKKQVVTIKSIEVTAGLMGLIRGDLNIGTATITGVQADIVKSSQGKTNLETLAKSTGASSSGGGSASIPTNLKAKVVLKSVGASFTDETAKGADGKALSVSLSDFSADASVATGEALSVKAAGTAISSSAGAKPGSISVTATIDHWSSAAGAITADKANVDATVDIKNLPTALIDAFAPGVIQGGSIRNALGESADITVIAKGTMAGGKADITASAPNASVKAKVTMANNTLTNDAPIEVRVSRAGVEGFAPTLKASLNQANATVDTLPDASLMIDKVRFVMPQNGAAMNLKGCGAVITANLTDIRGQVKLQEGAAFSPFHIAPLAATIDAADLGGTVRVQASTTADLSGEKAGALTADVTVQGLLDKGGAVVKGMPAGINGEVALKSVATAIAQPFVKALNLDLPRDVGPTLDVQAKIASTGGANAPADIDISIQSQYLKVQGGVRYATDRITLREGGAIRIDAQRAATMAGRFVKPDTGYALVASRPDAKGATISITALDVPMTKAGKPDAAKLAAKMDVVLDGVSLVPLTHGAADPPLDIETMTIGLNIAAGSGVRGTINSALWHESKPFSMAGTFDVAGLLGNDKDGNFVVTMNTMRPTAAIELKNVPATIAHLVPKAPVVVPANGEPAPKPVDLAKLLSGLAGPQFSIVLNAKGVEGSQGEYDVTSTLRADRLTADFAARGGEKQISIKKLAAQASVTPETVRGLMETFAPDVQGAPQLASASTLTLTVDPITIPFDKAGKPDFATVAPVAVVISLPGRTLISGLTRTDATGKTSDLGIFGLQDFSINASAPVAALMGPAPEGKRHATVKLAGMLLGNAGGREASSIGVLDGDVSADLSDKALAGPLAVTFKIDQINTVAVERIIGQSGMISGAVGDSATITLTANVAPPADAKPGQAFDFAAATTTTELSIVAPKLKSNGPLSATLSPTAFKLNKASKFTLNADPAWVNKTFLTPKAAPGAAAGPASMTLTQIAPIDITLDKLSVPFKGAPAGSAKLEAALALTIANMSFTADGKAMRLGATSVSVTSQAPGAGGTPVDFRLGINDLAVGDAGATKTVEIRGTIDNIIDSAGNVDAAKAVINTHADIPSIPTALLDAFSTKDGTMVDALGPVAAFKITVERFPMSGVPIAGSAPPVIDVSASSDRANAKLKGTVRDNMYVSVEPLTANIVEVTQKLSERYIKGLPLFGTFEKTKADQPATLNVTSITAPLNNDMSKLNADVVLDPGEARFGTSGVFGKLLKIVKGKTEGQVGKRLPPLTVKIRNGVATYPNHDLPATTPPASERWEVPLGEFTVQTEGTVDLVRRTIDVVTFIPITALSDEAMGSLNLGAGGVLSKVLPGAANQLTMVPFRTKGPLDNPSTGIDAEMMAKNAAKTLDPKRILKDNLGDLLKPKTPTPTSPK